MARPHLIFLVNRHNPNSIAALTGAFDTATSLDDVAVHFIWWNAQAADRVLDLAEQASETIGEDEQSIWLALSFATADQGLAKALLRDLEARPSFRRRIRVIAGGPHPSGDPEDVLLMGADVVVVGEGERAFPDLLLHLRAGEPLAGLPGVAVWAGGGIVRGPRAQPVDLEQYPPFSLRHERFSPLEITRGCPFACGFCQTPFLLGGKVRHRSVSDLCEYVARAVRQGYAYLRFITPNAFGYGSPDGRTVTLAAVEELLDEMSRLMPRERIYFGSFPSEVRPESVSPEAVTLVRRYASNDNLAFGAQTGSPRLLESLRRGHTVEDVYRAARFTLEGGLRPIIDFIFGLPGETEEDVRLTVKVIEDLTDLGSIVHSHTFMPLPGTPLSTAQPGRISVEYHPLLDRLASEGAQFGQWRKQEELSWGDHEPR